GSAPAKKSRWLRSDGRQRSRPAGPGCGARAPWPAVANVPKIRDNAVWPNVGLRGGCTMLQALKRAATCSLGCAAATLTLSIAFTGPVAAQSGQPIRIGFSMAMTGGLGPNGKSALLAQKIWEEDINAKGGLLGRPVKLVYYDDQTNPATVPGIYSKLLDVDKVDLI